MSTTLPLFSLLPPNPDNSYPSSPTFSDPSFPVQYDPLTYPFPTSTAQNGTSSSYASRHLAGYPSMMGSGFGHPAFGSTTDHDDPTAFLDLDLSQPGPSSYAHAAHHPPGTISHANGSASRIYGTLTHPSSVAGSFDLDVDVDLDGSDGNEFVQPQSDDEGQEELVKMENGEIIEGAEQGELAGDEGEVDNEEPLYVNAKQYHRILKRRLARARLEELNRLVRSRKPYLHESRHRHACSRPRGKGGRFLTAEEIEALKKEEAEKAESAGSAEGGASTEPVTGESTETSPST
ncbi:hypothetical protein IAU60_003379 [Kwoniella sp. DSM 27419]